MHKPCWECLGIIFVLTFIYGYVCTVRVKLYLEIWWTVFFYERFGLSTVTAVTASPLLEEEVAEEEIFISSCICGTCLVIMVTKSQHETKSRRA